MQRKVEVVFKEDVEFPFDVKRTGEVKTRYLGPDRTSVIAEELKRVARANASKPIVIVDMGDVDLILDVYRQPVPETGAFYRALMDSNANGPYETPKSWLWDLFRGEKR